MTDKNFMRVEDVARELDVSKSYAYKIVQKLNKELESKGYITISGRVNRQYFLERTCYGGSAEDSERKEGINSILSWCCNICTEELARFSWKYST
ncbi:hypothetical protein SAMN02910447_02250 [Ruminococcus sp. YE71]|nr:hypothetical protein SAMN02910446_02118 [Ruminococcus sp. YE78]SFW39012.1 hypothetical protein SAMN02910447_02250 [Ruminococcus sp. YE71]